MSFDFHSASQTRQESHRLRFGGLPPAANPSSGAIVHFPLECHTPGLIGDASVQNTQRQPGGTEAKGAGVRVQGSDLRVQGSGFRTSGYWFEVKC